MSKPLLDIRGLRASFHTDTGVVKAIGGVSLTVARGETLGIVGESGCGKSVTSLAVMGLLPTPPARIEAGEILFDGQDLLKLDPSAMRRIRGKKIAMVFQDPMTSLNPVMRIRRQLTEGMRLHDKLSRADADKRAADLLGLVGIPSPEKRLNDYPHQFSGGMRQRVMIAMALACNPGLIIADEPTTALDVTIQAQILELMKKLQRETDSAIILITHDLGIVAGMCDRVAVMYAGKIVEQADTAPLFAGPLHPYTHGLLGSLPRLDAREKEKLVSIPGMPPDLVHFPTGCAFSPRCEFAIDRCRAEEPPLREIQPGRLSACWVADRPDRPW